MHILETPTPVSLFLPRRYNSRVILPLGRRIYILTTISLSTLDAGAPPVFTIASIGPLITACGFFALRYIATGKTRAKNVSDYRYDLHKHGIDVPVSIGRQVTEMGIHIKRRVL